MPRLFYDDEYEAIQQAITSSERSYKEVAHFLWPARKPETAYARLKACLNPEKEERLTFGEIIAVCKYCERFDPLMFFCDEVSHDRPKQLAKEEELERLLRQYLDAVKVTQRVGPSIERLRSA